MKDSLKDAASALSQISEGTALLSVAFIPTVLIARCVPYPMMSDCLSKQQVPALRQEVRQHVLP